MEDKEDIKKDNKERMLLSLALILGSDIELSREDTTDELIQKIPEEKM